MKAKFQVRLAADNLERLEMGRCYNHPPKKGGISVTVCVAAICEGNSYLIGASDRMLTTSDIEFEPQQSKIVFLQVR